MKGSAGGTPAVNLPQLIIFAYITVTNQSKIQKQHRTTGCLPSVCQCMYILGICFGAQSRWQYSNTEMAVLVFMLDHRQPGKKTRQAHDPVFRL